MIGGIISMNLNKPVNNFRNSDIKSITMGIPGADHKHLRAVIETEDSFIVFQEATLAALVRAYIRVKTHPVDDVVRLVGGEIDNRKPGYASWQLLEDEKKDSKEFLEDIL
jgi:hypothetical protein